jgi:hypothetical protein
MNSFAKNKTNNQVMKRMTNDHITITKKKLQDVSCFTLWSIVIWLLIPFFKKGVDYKPGSVSHCRGTVIIPLMVQVALYLMRPTRVLDGPSMPLFGGTLFGLASNGVYQAPVSPRDW